MGVTGVDKIDNFYEYNVEQGGPIAKDKLWFYGAFRHARYDKPIANTFVHAGRRAVSGGVRAVRRRLGSLRAGHLRREDGQPDRPPHLAGLAAQQVRGVQRPRDAAARPRDDGADRPGDRLGGLAHADLRDRLGEVDLDRDAAAARSKAASRSTASATTTCIRTASSAERNTAGVVQRRAQERHQPRVHLERRRAHSSATTPTATTWPRPRRT